MAHEKRSTPWRILEVPVMRRVLGAFAVSKIGDLLYGTALVVVVLQQTGSAQWVSWTVIAAFLPYGVVAPFAGVLADRMDRRRLMVITDLVRAVLMVLAAVLVAARAPVAILIGLAFVSASVGTPFFSALNASLPELLEEDRLPAANAATQAIMNVGILIGPVLATLVLGLGTQWLPFAVNAATFLVSAALLSGVRATRAATPGESSEPSEPEVQESFGAALLTGARSMFGSRFLRFVLLIALPALLVFGLELVLLPLVSRDLLGTGEAGLGALTAATGLGGVLGVGLAARLAQWDRVLWAFSLSVIATTVPLGLLSVISVPVVAYAVLLVEGAGSVALEVVLITAIQRVLPLNQVARVDALITATGVGATLIGSAAAPSLVQGVGLAPTLAGVAIVCTAVSLVAAVIGGRERVAAGAPDLVAFLRGVRSLDGLDEAGYEALATAAGPVERVAEGQTLLAQGDPADEVLLLVSGSCDVFATGRDDAGLQVLLRVNQVRGPDLLGEIGVLQRRPRTATVVATGECEVRRIPAHAVATVLVPGADLPLALSITVNARLSRWSA